MQLTTENHSRDSAGLTYIYPVISRRAGGLSIGVNVNTNNACNWRCIYCQVPNLMRGAAPAVDFALLEKELRWMLNEVLAGDFFERFQVPANQRVIKDIAISGNGEPTSVKAFAKLVELIGGIARTTGIQKSSNLVLITNGSLVHHAAVRQGLAALKTHHGQIWFKLDSATAAGRQRINNAAISLNRHLDNLVTAARLCPTWIQTCLFDYQGQGLSNKERAAYLNALRSIKDKADFLGVMLYTLARPSQQPETAQLSKLNPDILEAFAADIRSLGFTVQVNR